MKKMRTRPRKNLPQAAIQRICREIASGKSLRKVLKAPSMPTRATFMDLLREDAQLSDQYARARREGIEAHIDQIVDLADTATAENAQAVRLKLDTRKWLASKLVPKVYGDRLALEGGLELTDARQGPIDKPLEAWTKEERLDWARRQVYQIAAIGQQLRDVWGLPDLASGFGYLGDQAYKQLLEVIEGRRPMPVKPAGLLAAPGAPKPKESDEERREVEINPRQSSRPPALPHYPDREEQGL